MDVFQVIDPMSGERGEVFPCHTPAEVEALLSQAAEAQRAWSRVSFEARAAVLRRAAALLEAEVETHGRRMSQEMGKPVAQAIGEARKCALACRHYAAHAEGYLSFEAVPTEAVRSGVRFDPLGVVLAIMPWNYPYWQVFRFAAPALMAGNGFVLKHAPTVPGCAEAIVELLHRAGLPAGVAVNLRVDVGAVEALLADPRIAAVTLTGSTRAGRAVAALAGANLKPCVLELGGSDPFIVLNDADLDLAVATAVTGRLQNNGQSCIAAKRFILERGIASAFLEAFEARLRAATLGDPLVESTLVGPLAREDLREVLHAQVVQSVQAGAQLVLGGEVPEGAGWGYPPTLLVGCGPGHKVWDEETFGPVAAVQIVDSPEQALRAAHQTTYGLGACVFTQSLAMITRFEREIQAGAVFANTLVRSDPRVPFGGLGVSGMGRELGEAGIREFVNAKTVWVEGSSLSE